MSETSDNSALAQFQQERKEIHSKVIRCKQRMHYIWLLLWLPTTAVAGYIAFNHNSLPAEILAGQVIPLLKWGGLACTIFYLAYIVMHIPMVRTIYHGMSVVYPRYNRTVSEADQKPFQWSAFFSRDIENVRSGKSVTFTLATKAISLFLLIILYQLSWIHALSRIGVELNNEHYSFMGFIDFALFSSVILFAVLLITTRISSLAAKKS